jgi:hypothetical protein
VPLNIQLGSQNGDMIMKLSVKVSKDQVQSLIWIQNFLLTP